MTFDVFFLLIECADHSTTPAVMGMGEPNVGVFIDDHKRRADADLNAPPYDDLRNYAYEGGGSTAGSLSSLASGCQSFLIFCFQA